MSAGTISMSSTSLQWVMIADSFFGTWEPRVQLTVSRHTCKKSCVLIPHLSTLIFWSPAQLIAPLLFGTPETSNASFSHSEITKMKWPRSVSVPCTATFLPPRAATAESWSGTFLASIVPNQTKSAKMALPNSYLSMGDIRPRSRMSAGTRMRGWWWPVALKTTSCKYGRWDTRSTMIKSEHFIKLKKI